MIRIANTLVVIGIVLNTASRYFGYWSGFFGIQPTESNTWHVFDYANIITLILFTTACYIVSQNKAAIAAIVVMVSLLFDKFFHGGLTRQTHVGWVDIIFYVTAAIILWIGKRRDFYYWAFALIGTLKIITDNSHIDFVAFGVERSVFGIGNTVVFLLLSIVYARLVRKGNLIVPIAAIICTVNDVVDEVFFDPYTTGGDEVTFFCFTVILAVLFEAGRRYNRASSN